MVRPNGCSEHGGSALTPSVCVCGPAANVGPHGQLGSQPPRAEGHAGIVRSTAQHPPPPPPAHIQQLRCPQRPPQRCTWSRCGHLPIVPLAGVGRRTRQARSQGPRVSRRATPEEQVAAHRHRVRARHGRCDGSVTCAELQLSPRWTAAASIVRSERGQNHHAEAVSEGPAGEPQRHGHRHVASHHQGVYGSIEPLA